jgi:hypothetical protein
VANSLVKAEKQSMAPAQWNLAWEEFGRRYPRLKHGPALLAFFVFTFLGQSVVGLVSAFYGLLPLMVWLLVFLSTTVLAQMFVINFSGKAYERQAAEHKAELDKLAEHELTFRVDEKRSLAYVNQEAGGITVIQVAVVMQFIKHGSNPTTMEDIELAFDEMLTNTSDCREISTFIFGEPLFQLLSTSENQDFRGRRFDPGVSPWFRFGAWVEIIGGDLRPADLNIKHSLRLTMTALNQAPLSASLYFDWSKAAEKPTSCFPVWPRSLAAPRRDHIMTYDKGDELKKLSEGFVLGTPANDKPA